jgi:membrane-associated phospholipid phosphatase
VSRQLAHVISLVLNPLTNPIIAFTLLVGAGYGLGSSSGILILFTAVFFASLVPIGYVLYLKRTRRIDSIDVDDRTKRLVPLAVGIASSLLGYYLLIRMGAPILASGLMFCFAVNTLLILVITRWWKISIHATGMGGPLVALSYQFGWIIAPFYLLVLVVAVARVVLDKHTVAQVTSGALLGMGMTALQLQFLFF